MPDRNLTDAILRFIEGTGIPVEHGQVPEDALLPGMTVRHGVLVVDRERVAYPGDLLHEAGHIAVMEPQARSATPEVSSDAAEEMAAIAWSYAAAKALAIDPGFVFHDHGYRGGGDYLGVAFESNPTSAPGVPMLRYYGMAANPAIAEQAALPPYPHMLRWLR